jgi:hypothetical protein
MVDKLGEKLLNPTRLLVTIRINIELRTFKNN